MHFYKVLQKTQDNMNEWPLPQQTEGQVYQHQLPKQKDFMQEVAL